MESTLVVHANTTWSLLHYARLQVLPRPCITVLHSIRIYNVTLYLTGLQGLWKTNIEFRGTEEVVIGGKLATSRPQVATIRPHVSWHSWGQGASSSFHVLMALTPWPWELVKDVQFDASMGWYFGIVFIIRSEHVNETDTAHCRHNECASREKGVALAVAFKSAMSPMWPHIVRCRSVAWSKILRSGTALSGAMYISRPSWCHPFFCNIASLVRGWMKLFLYFQLLWLQMNHW